MKASVWQTKSNKVPLHKQYFSLAVMSVEVVHFLHTFQSPADVVCLFALPNSFLVDVAAMIYTFGARRYSSPEKVSDLEKRTSRGALSLLLVSKAEYEDAHI